METGKGAICTISDRVDSLDHRTKAKVLLLFPAGGRPDLPTIRKTIDQIGAITISAEPGALPAEASSKSSLWVELLCEGMTFDLCGLAGGCAAATPDLRDTRGLLADAAGMEAIELKLGPHLEAGSRNLPIVRSTLAVGATLVGKLDGVLAVSWPASGAWLSPADFTRAIDGWLNGGAVPSPAMVDFRKSMANALQSVGLALFCDQELRLAPDLAMSDDDLRRLGIRIAGHLMHQGRLERVEEFSAPDGGLIRIAPSSNGRFVRASRG